MYKNTDTRDFHKPHVMKTVIDRPIACSVETSPRRKEYPVHLTPGDVGMLTSTKRSNNHSVMIPEFLDRDAGSSSKNQYKSVFRWSRNIFQCIWTLLLFVTFVTEVSLYSREAEPQI